VKTGKGELSKMGEKVRTKAEETAWVFSPSAITGRMPFLGYLTR